MLITFVRISIILTFTVIFSFLFIEELSKLEALKNENQKIEDRIKNLSSENDLLKLKIEALKNDDRYIEITARHELGMIKDGEKIIKFKK